MQTAARRYATAAAYHPQSASQEKKPLPVFPARFDQNIESFKTVEKFLSADAFDASPLLTREEQAVCDMATD